ncbi:hypothetical protein [Mycolicibacterium fortuitum]|uniref:Uncharacterized protein n=1 Tax=Mycolicibacterium fortuitum TaxID=1766 RepID=A0AAE4VF20_MYCFO|nr:hypothetical protein [Mycolicibacterium fortuitum]MDV7192614.1 hypothetical protein [Mycolicibacterium fortuitum]MDV7205515.1 hypothetical protein [Mycolicibacterium fortuitum]MDV7227096.1 hypothetical protein [Mycolicibacterium fortuitum]MDV7259659.1 hypothetical protein [Mycolicibacterium fortuitum]MDV7286222.1 hypothetical protein [Mycolicibacterium fortuitum]
MPKSKRDKRKRPPTVAEATRALEAAQRREAAAHSAVQRTQRRIDLANLDTPDVTHAEQYAEFLNRPGRFYVGQFEIPLDDQPLGQKLCTQTTFKADDQQLLYLVEVLRQIRGALGERTRITLAPAEPHVEERRLAGPARVTTTAPDGVTTIHRMARDVVRQRSNDDCNIRGKSSTPNVAIREWCCGTPVTDPHAASCWVAAADRQRASSTPDVAIREWCCGTPMTDPHLDDCAYQPRPDAPVDYTGPARVATAEDLAAVREMRARAEGQEFTREQLVDMLPGQTRSEVAQELGKAPENLGGTVHNADMMPEDLAAELGVPVESLQRIPIRGGGHAWAVKPGPAQPGGRHAAPDEPQS